MQNKEINSLLKHKFRYGKIAYIGPPHPCVSRDTHNNPEHSNHRRFRPLANKIGAGCESVSGEEKDFGNIDEDIENGEDYDKPCSAPKALVLCTLVLRSENWNER